MKRQIICGQQNQSIVSLLKLGYYGLRCFQRLSVMMEGRLQLRQIQADVEIVGSHPEGGFKSLLGRCSLTLRQKGFSQINPCAHQPRIKGDGFL